MNEMSHQIKIDFSSKHVRPIFGAAYELPDGTIEDEAETLGLTGQYTKNAASGLLILI